MTEEDVYSEEGREQELEDDEISPEEAGFMKGEEEAGTQTSEDESDSSHNKKKKKKEE